MSEPFIGEIRMFGGNFAPRGYAFCDGQLLSIAQNSALFSLLGTIYGGDGRTNFGLPDLRGRIPLHQGNGPGLTDRRIGQRGGVENVALSINEMPNHGHALTASPDPGATDDAQGGFRARSRVRSYRLNAPLNRTLSSASVDNAGANQPHNNMMPTLCVNYIIALLGVFPSRN